jgi:hypothetical protein
MIKSEAFAEAALHVARRYRMDDRDLAGPASDPSAWVSRKASE